MANRSKESYREENAQLKKRIKELEKSLSFSRLETEARDLMITRAEEYFNIQIRKNLGPNSNGTGHMSWLEGHDRVPSVWPLPSSFLPVESRYRKRSTAGADYSEECGGNPCRGSRHRWL